MANLPKPKILPKVTYDPPPDPNKRSLWGDINAVGGNMGFLNDWAQGAYNALNAGGDYVTGGAGKVARPDYGPPKVAYPDTPMGPPTPPTGWDARGGAGVDAPQGGMRVEMNAGTPTPPQTVQGTAGAGVPQSALTNNRNNYAAAQAAGDTANMARLDAEWKRIAPLAQQYGISAQRLVNSYMQPSNPAAKSDLSGALAAAISDDVWAKEATNAFGRPPNQLEWDEHFKAMNFGGRDPLEGHPQAVQNIQAAMNNIGQQNQQAGYDEYSKWLAGQ